MPASPTSLANFDERRSEGRTRALSKMPRGSNLLNNLPLGIQRAKGLIRLIV